MNNISNKFVLQEHNDDFQYKENKSDIDIKFNRVAFIFFIFFVISIIYTIHLLHLGSRKVDLKNYNQSKIINKLHRADIIDRNGNFLAKTVSSIDIGINPVEIIDQKKLLLNLGYIFPKKNFDLVKSNFKKNKFFWFEKKISEENYEKVMKLGDKSIRPEEKLTRIYPQKNLFSHIIGQIDNDNVGISGLEKSLDEKLKNNKNSIQLTVDKDIQFLIREELLKYNEIFQTIGSAAILMNVNNGEIISLVSLPDFDPNQRTNITDVNFINRATKGVYELGSVFKTFTLAAAFNEGIIEPSTKFNDLEKSIKCGKNTISEYNKNIPSNLTAEEILIRSGNIGSVRIGQSIGLDKFKKFMNELSLVNSIQFDIEEVGVPVSFKWGKCKLATASYGHGITTTILQLANAYSIIVNGGYKISPTLIKKKINLKRKKILKNNVSEKINLILRKIVTDKEGTASLANVDGYEVAGKTGTAQKSIVGGYSRKKINTFAAIFPASNPKYTLVVMLDEPKTNSDYIYNYRDGSGIKYKGTPFNTSGWTSVEVVGQIIDKIGPILATKYNEVN
ncbi:penicillin-binding protein 2 [Candidatus Pelagibacter sp.]|jgi:cell division protein FtsI (penicillin-binding protein 3)|nr:penicillin-binding protein 2 [Candidatus Pelagibacter sp.]